MVSSSERGAVTAEFLLLLPALLLMLASAIGLFQLGLERIALEVEVFEIARQVAIGVAPEVAKELSFTTTEEGRLKCVTLEKPLPLPITATRCMIPYGG